MMKTSGELKELSKLARLALDPEPLHRFIEIVENDLGFFLYRTVSRAKEELSTRDRTEFRFQHADINIQRSITRKEFEAWIREDVDRIAGTVDEALGNAGVAAAEIDKVFLTAAHRSFRPFNGSLRIGSAPIVLPPVTSSSPLHTGWRSSASPQIAATGS